jgi:hypothetical protein
MQVGSEALTALVKNNSFFWNIIPCSQLEGNRLFGEIYRLYLHGLSASQA